MKKRLEVRQVAVAFLTKGPSSPADAQLQLIHSPGFPLNAVQFWRLTVAEPGTVGQEHLLYMLLAVSLPIRSRRKEGFTPESEQPNGGSSAASSFWHISADNQAVMDQRIVWSMSEQRELGDK